jgi:cation transport regulator ChaC
MPDIPSLQLQNGESAIFGYGSLLLKSHMELTLGRPYNGPFVSCFLQGWQRSWDVIMPNTTFYTETPSGPMKPGHIVYLNVRPNADNLLNGVLFVVRPEELTAFDQREWIYDRRTITQDLRGIAITGGDAYVYVGKPERILPPGLTREHGAVRRTYLDIIEKALRAWGPDFRAQYDASTEVAPQHLVMDDRKIGDGTEPLLAERQPRA